jgi:hypothetical protein
MEREEREDNLRGVYGFLIELDEDERIKYPSDNSISQGG